MARRRRPAPRRRMASRSGRTSLPAPRRRSAGTAPPSMSRRRSARPGRGRAGAAGASTQLGASASRRFSRIAVPSSSGASRARRRPGLQGRSRSSRLGSSDLTPSNNTKTKNLTVVAPGQYGGRYIHYGIREHGMAAAMNGLAFHGGLRPAGATFLVFTDYARPAIRIAALSGIPAIYVLTHDSIGLGEDGPTHQPVEHASMLRLTPGMSVWRPADLVETAIAWEESLAHHNGPSALLLSRQNLPALKHNIHAVENIKKGGYILQDCEGTPKAL